MELLFGVVVGVLILTVLVALHELGHAIVAHYSGVAVEEFGIGFPPRAWGKKLKNGVIFSINWLPLGGFVKLQGEHDAARKKGDYGAASFWVKTKILLAGVLVNWLTAVLLLTILAVTGLPKFVDDQYSVPSDTTITNSPVTVTEVTKGSPADKAGLRQGDQIVSFSGSSISTAEALHKATAADKGQKVAIVYARGGTKHDTEATLRADNKDGQGFLGIGTGQQSLIHATWSAPIVGVATTWQLTSLTFSELGKLAHNLASGVSSQLSSDQKTRDAGNKDLAAAGNSVGGPVTIIGKLFPAAQQAGLTQLTFATAIISLTLAVMNVLPIPALDGGRWFTMVVFRLARRKLTKEREEQIQAAGFITLMALVLVVTYLDVTKLIR